MSFYDDAKNDMKHGVYVGAVGALTSSYLIAEDYVNIAGAELPRWAAVGGLMFISSTAGQYLNDKVVSNTQWYKGMKDKGVWVQRGIDGAVVGVALCSLLGANFGVDILKEPMNVARALGYSIVVEAGTDWAHDMVRDDAPGFLPF